MAVTDRILQCRTHLFHFIQIYLALLLFIHSLNHHDLIYIPESLQRLYSYNKPQRKDLILTLQTYLDNNQSLNKTAQALFIHYKTATYRIDKIGKMTGMDFKNPNEMLNVRIGLILYKMLEKAR